MSENIPSTDVTPDGEQKEVVIEIPPDPDFSKRIYEIGEKARLEKLEKEWRERHHLTAHERNEILNGAKEYFSKNATKSRMTKLICSVTFDTITRDESDKGFSVPEERDFVLENLLLKHGLVGVFWHRADPERREWDYQYLEKKFASRVVCSNCRKKFAVGCWIFIGSSFEYSCLKKHYGYSITLKT